MKYTENAINILAAKNYKGIGRAWITKKLTGNETIENIVFLLNRDSKEPEDILVEDFISYKNILKKHLEHLNGFADGLIAIGDKNFPLYRGTVKNSEQPIFLFYQGDISLLNPVNKNISVIGLLNPDNEIENTEQEVVKELINKNITIVSGLALGCDTVAHRQALDSHGRTIAILPGPLDAIIPAANKDLANEIVEKKGLLISEYYEDVKSKMELSSRYQERDRLQALFSDCIILTASYAKNDKGNDSGSRLAMEYALNYSIPRAVIYNDDTDLENSKYDLNRQLIKEDKDITIINRINIKESIQKIISKKPNTINQMNLFDF
ncbi:MULTISPECIES: DNA-processing protein DprA [unclassified Sphingobacterium]|uniref:DNA-processing protein DprA n=1 Tax=unclassified Sphingobacterium TaxID=2609468 RepID=UPI00105107D1|nr:MULTISPECIES: DNA-processing protein DprA [unclassified Sphingobacterium]MCS3552327.1 DNA processing protein [Sphingobacterium sp. JUb21]TCR10907.1 DNA processing protein [Sphingobacterium sp. JUb20]